MSNKKTIIGVVIIALTAAGIVAGYFGLKNVLESRYGIDVDEESQKAFYVGTYADEKYPISVHVALITPQGNLHERTLSGKDFNFNTSGQQSVDTIWCNLTDFAAEATGNARIDEWIGKGGVIRFDSTQAGKTSVAKECSYGGGAYLVHGPKDDGNLVVEYNTVSIYVPEDYVQ